MNDNTPPSGPDHTSDVTPAPAPAAAPHETRSRPGRGLLVAGVAAAVVLAAGVGAAFALVVSGNDDDTIGFENSSTSSPDGPANGGPTVAGDDTDLDTMLQAVAQALTVADGHAVSIEERSPGTWHIEVQGNGREVDVVVDSAGARVVDEDDDDDGDDLPLTAEVIEQIVAVATNHTAGRVVQIESDDDGYDVDVRTANGSIVELELNGSGQIIDADHDDDGRDDD